MAKEKRQKMQLSKAEKIMKVLSIIVLVITAVIIFGRVEVALTQSGKSHLVPAVAVSVMEKKLPESTEAQLQDGTTVEAFVEYNKHYDKDKGESLISFYYYDENGEKVVINSNTDRTNMINIAMAFVEREGTGELIVKAQTFIKVAKVLWIVLIVLDVFAVLFIIFLFWSSAQDRKAARDQKLKELAEKREEERQKANEELKSYGQNPKSKKSNKRKKK